MGNIVSAAADPLYRIPMGIIDCVIDERAGTSFVFKRGKVY